MAADVTPLRKVELRKVPAHAPEPEPLWREVLGSRLRELRRERQEKLTETAGRAGVSPQHPPGGQGGPQKPSSQEIRPPARRLCLPPLHLTPPPLSGPPLPPPPH